jgi:hypothetical protein
MQYNHTHPHPLACLQATERTALEAELPSSNSWVAMTPEAAPEAARVVGEGGGGGRERGRGEGGERREEGEGGGGRRGREEGGGEGGGGRGNGRGRRRHRVSMDTYG